MWPAEPVPHLDVEGLDVGAREEPDRRRAARAARLARGRAVEKAVHRWLEVDELLVGLDPDGPPGRARPVEMVERLPLLPDRGAQLLCRRIDEIGPAHERPRAAGLDGERQEEDQPNQPNLDLGAGPDALLWSLLCHGGKSAEALPWRPVWLFDRLPHS